MFKRYGSIIDRSGPQFSKIQKDEPQKNEPALAIEGYAVLFNEPIGLTSGEIVVFEPGCFDRYLATKSTDFRFSHDETRVVGSTNSGLEFYVNDIGLAFRMQLSNKRYADTIKEMVNTKKQSAISIGITRSHERQQMVGKHRVDYVDECDLTEISLVAEGCCAEAFAYLIDTNEMPSLKDSVASPLFNLESATHNIGAQSKRRIRRLERLAARLEALQATPTTRVMTVDESNRARTEWIQGMQTRFVNDGHLLR